jgi:hypothetical protein
LERYPRDYWRPCADGDPGWDYRLAHWPTSRVTWTKPYDMTDHAFAPDYRPDQMLRMGVFGDGYYSGTELGDQRWALLSWTGWDRTRSGVAYRTIRGRQCRDVNWFGKAASLSRDWWLERGLIAVYDPLGWFEWYCWFYLGRRITGYDTWQVERWRSFRQRHGTMYRMRPSAGQAQALLHWGVRVGDGPTTRLFV